MKKITYYLTALLFISAEIVFCQPDVCQSQLIPEEHKLFKSLLSIVEDIKSAKANSENLNLKDYLLERGKNSDKAEGMINELPTLFEDKIFYEIGIIPLSAVVKSETGEVNFKMIITTENGSFEYNLILKFVKESNVWVLNDDDYSRSFLSFLDKNYNPIPTEAITTFTVRESDKTLIRYRIKSDTDIWELNKNVTWSNLNRWLFANQSPIDVDVYQISNNWPYTTAAFYLDPYWHRIVYSKYNSSDIKAFDIEFYQGAQFPSEPSGITIDDWGKIYVADKRNNCLIKLYYVPQSNSIGFNSKINIPGLDVPTDVVYSSHTTPNNSTDDYLLIANKNARNIIKTSLSGTVLNIVTRFKTGGVYYNFISPSRITQVPGTTYIAVIDEALKYLIVGRIEESNTLVCHNVIKFNNNQYPTDVGVNCFGDLLVTDNSKAIHKFTYIGVYLCTYSSNSFNFPQRISRVNDQLYYVFDQASADLWSASNGIKRFIPGSDAFNLSYQQFPTEHRFLYTLSDFSQVRLEILNSNNQVIRAFDYSYMTSGRKEEFLALNQIPVGNYKFRVKHRPLFDENYGGYQQGWRYTEITFSVALSVTITGDTNPPRYTTSTFSSETNGQGVTYYWEMYVVCCTEGNDCGYYFSKGNGSTLSVVNVGYHYRLRLTVTDWANRSAQDIHYVTVEYCVGSGGGGCPTLAFNVEGWMKDDNPLLITSLSNPGTDVTDYYLVQNPVTPIGDKINLRIHEPQTEHTWLDYVELIEAKVKIDELVAVNDEGEIINYKKLSSPVTVLLNGATDITFLLAEIDTLDITLTEGDVLTIQRSSLSAGDGEDEDLIVGGIILPIKDLESITLRLAKKGDNNEDNPRFGGIFLRPNKSIMAKKLRNLPPGDIEIVINKTLTLDYLTIAKNIKTAKVMSLDLLSANHSIAGNVKALLSGIDQNYAEIIPGEIIDFEFKEGNTPAEKTAYILKSVGRYETDTTLAFNKLTSLVQEEIIPKENKLFDNYPNPFNPATQIKYSVKENGMVTLKVYDVLGNEVATLVNEEKQAGTYTVTFDAGKMASGIYFYTISANDFHQTKKMLLIK